MAYGVEKRNVRSELSLREDTSVVAHTRRRTVMRPAVPSPMVRSCSFSSNSEVTTIAKEKRNVWTGRMIEVSKLAKCMDQASKDCIQEGKCHKFPVFVQEQEPKESTGRRIQRDSFEEDSDSEDEEFDESPATYQFHEEDATTEDSIWQGPLQNG